MHAMLLERPGIQLEPRDWPNPEPEPGEVLLRVEACGVCRTDLHVVDGELPFTVFPIVPGHEIVGRVETVGSAVQGIESGQRIGVPWLGRTCGTCLYCRSQQENLCDAPTFTGCTVHGGFASHVIAAADWCIPLDDVDLDPVSIAPLLCAGLIGWRSLRAAGDGARLGLYGFGAAASLLAQIARFQDREVYAFTRPGDMAAQDFARSLGAVWAGGSDTRPDVELDAAIIFAPVGALVPMALRAVRKGGRVVCGGIHMSEIPAFPYSLLWEERQLRSVANLTRRDGEELFAAISDMSLVFPTHTYALDDANKALEDLRLGAFQGAAVLVP